MDIQRIAIIGIGNVGSHLVEKFLELGINVIIADNRKDGNKAKSKYPYCQFLNDFAEIKADLCIVTVRDQTVNEVINTLPQNLEVAFTSGSISLESLDRKKKIGVFYPLQTFSKDTDISFDEIPFLIESDDQNLEDNLMKLAKRISTNVHVMDSEKRQEIHVAAVFINNFINHQIYIAQQLAEKYSFDKQLLYPLLKETIKKAMKIGAFDAQTGPARRGDIQVISYQKALLPEDFVEMYHSISESIIKTYNQEKSNEIL